MSSLMIGIFVYILLIGLLFGFMIPVMRQARTKGITGPALLKRLLPIIVGYGALTLALIAWIFATARG
jgi:hypothetical protein